MAIMMALHGGLGIIHYNMSVAEQVSEVIKVKKYRNGFITDPKCLPPTATAADVQAIKVWSERERLEMIKKTDRDGAKIWADF